MQKSSVRRAKLFKAFWADHHVSPAQAKSADVMACICQAEPTPSWSLVFCRMFMLGLSLIGNVSRLGMHFFRIFHPLPLSSSMKRRACNRPSYSDSRKYISQRCLVHVERFVRTCVSRNPQTETGKQLWLLARLICKVRSQENARSWVRQFTAWQDRSAGFLAERSRSGETGRWWYTHIEGYQIAPQQRPALLFHLHRGAWSAAHE